MGTYASTGEGTTDDGGGMVEVVRTTQDGTAVVDLPLTAADVWVKVSDPTDAEAALVCDALDIDRNDFASAVDTQEKVRMQVEDGYTLVLLDVPVSQARGGKDAYGTIPLGVFLCERSVVTVCAQDTPFLTAFSDGDVRGFSTRERRRFAYRLMLNSAIHYQGVLASVDRCRVEFEGRIAHAMSETDLVSLHELESTLVYLTTSLRGNDNVLTRLMRHCRDRCSEEDLDMLEDAIVENQRAIEMAHIYRDIIDGTRELLSSVMDLRLNNVMQRLTSVTVIMSIPTIVAGIYGMNFDPRDVPLALAEGGFAIVCALTVVACALIAAYLRRRRLL